MKALFFDTETTGLPLFHEPSEDERQPHLVQLAALLVELETREVLSTIDLTIKPDGWEIPDDVAKIHGITTEIALATGVPEREALDQFLKLWAGQPRVAHNEQFDARIIRIAMMRYPDVCGWTSPDAWKMAPAQCTQRLATPLMKLPPTAKMIAAGFKKPKSANLREAYKHFTREDLVDAHSAIADARACMAVYFAIKALARAA